MQLISSTRLSLVLALWLGVMSMGWTITFHYCNDHLAGVTILGEVDQCCSSQKKTSCPATKKECSNNSYSLDIEIDAYSQAVILSDFAPSCALLPRSHASKSLTIRKDLSSIFLDIPPLIPKDIPVFNCSFLL